MSRFVKGEVHQIIRDWLNCSPLTGAVMKRTLHT